MAGLTQSALAAHNKAESVATGLGSKAEDFAFADGSDYSFRAMLDRKLQSDQQSSRQSTSGGGDEGAGDPTCRTCDLPKVKGAAYCMKHKKAYQNLMNASLKKDKQTGTFANPTAASRFEALFGKGREAPPDLALANKVIIEQTALNETSSGGKTSQKRLVGLATFTHSQGVRHSMSSDSKNPKWELEIFITQMKALRGWSAEQATNVYRRLEAEPGRFRDDLGWKGASRIEIPSNLVGGDMSTESNERFENKELGKSSKPKRNMGEDEELAIQAEMGAGFGTLATPVSEDLHTPLPVGAITSSSSGSGANVSSVGLIMQAGQQLEATLGADAPADACGEPAGQTSVKVEEGGSASAASAASGEGDKKKDEKLDPLVRNKAVNKLADEVEAAKKKLQHQLKASAHVRVGLHAAVDTESLRVLTERARVAEHFLGEEAPSYAADADNLPAQIDDVKLQPMKYQVPTAAEDGAQPEQEPGAPAASTSGPPPPKRVCTESSQQKELSDSIQACSFCPIESPKMKCLVQIVSLAETGKQCTTHSQLEEVLKEVREQRALMMQLHNSLGKAVAEVKNIDRRKKNQDQQREAGAASKVAAEKRKQAHQLESEEKKRLSKVKLTAAFRMDFTQVAAIPQHADADSLVQARGSDGFSYSEPFKVTRVKVMADIMDDASNKLKATLDRWKSQYPETSIAAADDMVHAPLLFAHGLRELDPLMKKLLPSADRVCSALPRLSKHDGQVDLFGYTKVCVLSDLEKDYLGTIRINVFGVARVLAMPAVEVVAQLKAAKKHCTMENLRGYLINLDQTALSQLIAKGAALKTCLLEPFSVLYIPPGWAVALTQVDHDGNTDAVSGMRFSFLPKHNLDEISKQIQALKDLTGADVDWCASLLDIIVAEGAVAPSSRTT